jgi:hypothetical protein
VQRWLREVCGEGSGGVASTVLVDGYEGCDAWEELRGLARGSGCVVMEDMPVEPYRSLVMELAAQSMAPLVVVDTACLVPMKSVAKAYLAASAFRTATAARRAALLSQEQLRARGGGGELGARALVKAAVVRSGGFVPEGVVCRVLERKEDAVVWVQGSRADLSVGRVTHSVGGERHARARWHEYVAGKGGCGGLPMYARTRNDVLKDKGVSRMSAYLHYGMLSVREMAQDAVCKGKSGAGKFLDELLVWRELSYCFCKYTKKHDFTALPAWAQATLNAHASDQRSGVQGKGRAVCEEEMEAARSGDSMWDAMQVALVATGQLHNNLRMTWGKAFATWLPSPPRALDFALYNNDRYALDGSDPCSVGGVLWCFGLFDGPKVPDRPVLGSVRARPSSVHAKRFSAQTLRLHLNLPPAP